jgi:hypothetical protein
MPAQSRLARPLIALVSLLAACSRPPPVIPNDAPPIPLAEAKAAFADAATRCTADHGALWGVPLCGPIMVVDRDARFVVANQADELGKLAEASGVFVGTLPADENIANTATTWAGVRWVQLGWPLPADRQARGVLMMHEQFHRIAADLAMPLVSVKLPEHLDSTDGRYWLQLEWRALAAALTATTDDACKAAIADAFAFRRARWAGRAEAAETEVALELNEGLAEYTGVKVGLGDPAAQTAAAVHDLAAHVDDPSFVRSFAYATGPAYGLLLDRFAPAWRGQVAREPSLADSLAAAVQAPEIDANAAARRYAGGELRKAEDARAAERAARQARFQRALVDGPVLRLAFRHMKIEFNPSNVLVLADHGTVYPTLRVVDDWGVLAARSGALVASDFSAVTVAAPPGPPGDPRELAGPGWTLQLTPGWHVVPGARAGDLQLAHDELPTIK